MSISLGSGGLQLLKTLWPDPLSFPLRNLVFLRIVAHFDLDGDRKLTTDVSSFTPDVSFSFLNLH